MIKAIIFDCFGVLTTDLWKEFVSTLPDNQKNSARDFNHLYNASLITKEEFNNKILELTGVIPGIDKSTELGTNKNIQLLQYIKKLKQKYKIGILSNIASNWITASFLTTDEQALFDSITLSYEVRLTKPDSEIFRIACKRLAVEPSETIMIDDIEQYCESAQSIGMQAICYKNFAQMQSELTFRIDESSL